MDLAARFCVFQKFRIYQRACVNYDICMLYQLQPAKGDKILCAAAKADSIAAAEEAAAAAAAAAAADSLAADSAAVAE